MVTYVKICGITNVGDALEAARAGADMIGFIFYPSSPRFVSPERARRIVMELHQRLVPPSLVGVFVNETLDRIRSIQSLTGIDYAQLHGDESPDLVRALAPNVYKSVRPRHMADAEASVEKYHASVEGLLPAFIVDTFSETEFGGTGKRTDWQVAHTLALKLPVLLAGGLNPENVTAAIRTVHPWGVDVSSGVERAPGMKDHARVREFVRRAKQVEGV